MIVDTVIWCLICLVFGLWLGFMLCACLSLMPDEEEKDESRKDVE